MENNPNDVRTALARAVAEYKVADDVIEVAAKQIAALKHQIRGIDVCSHGICIDFFVEGKEWWNILPELVVVEGARLKGIEVFPYGIIWPDILHVRITQNLDGMMQVGR